jgi:hypothetical protein
VIVGAYVKEGEVGPPFNLNSVRPTARTQSTSETLDGKKERKGRETRNFRVR